MRTVERLEKAKKEFNEASNAHSKALDRMNKIQLGQEVFISGTHGWDIEYYPCVVKEKNEETLMLKIYEPSIRRYHEVDVTHVYIENELDLKN